MQQATAETLGRFIRDFSRVSRVVSEVSVERAKLTQGLRAVIHLHDNSRSGCDGHFEIEVARALGFPAGAVVEELLPGVLERLLVAVKPAVAAGRRVRGGEDECELWPDDTAKFGAIERRCRPNETISGARTCDASALPVGNPPLAANKPTSSAPSALPLSCPAPLGLLRPLLR
jgi:hypothetical protein